MKAVAVFLLLLIEVRSCRSCQGEGGILFCTSIPPGEVYTTRPGYSSLLMTLKDVGEINSTVFGSDNLSSVTRLRMENAGVTGIAEGAFGSFQNLTSLSLDQNLLAEMNPRWLGRPDILGELSLAGNHIEVLNESMLHGLIHLTSLSLSNNRIRTIDPNSFISHSNLTALDLSDNRMTRVSPQVFRFLRSTRIRLDGNPWDCSCGAEDVVDFLKDLLSRSLLDRPMDVTCESPPSLRGRPAWNMSVCAPSPPSRPPSVMQTVHPKPTDVLTAIPAATSASYVTSPPSVTQISVHPEPSDLPTTTSRPTRVTETCVTSPPSSGTSIVLGLVAVIVVLSLLLVLACFLPLLREWKRNGKTVTPGRPEENGDELNEDGGSSRTLSPGHSEKREDDQRDSEMGWMRSFTGVRAKSANAILSLSPEPVRDKVTLHTETEAPSQDAEEKQKQGDESQGDGGDEAEPPNTADVIENAQQADAGGNHHVSVNTDAAPYLSVGTNQQKPTADEIKQDAGGPGQRSQRGRVLGRISTWPPTAVQWQARCKMNEYEEAGAFTVWTPKFPGEVENVKNDERPSSFHKKDDDVEKNQIDDLQTAPEQGPLEMSGHSQSPSRSDSSLEEQLKKEETIQEDPTTEGRSQHLNEEQLGPNSDLKSAENPAHKKNSKKSSEPKRAAMSRRNTSTGPKAPSGGASPDDETLLSGNEYAFVDLLHEVVQNNGRWTRERWRQVHVNKQRRHDGATEDV